jgi:hypothetical protein
MGDTVSCPTAVRGDPTIDGSCYQIGALADFDYAVALKPEERFVYTSTRESYGL